MEETITLETTVKAEGRKENKARRGRRKPLQLAPGGEAGCRKATVVGLDVSEKYIQICEIDVDDVVSEGRIATTDKKIREFFEGKTVRRMVIEMSSHTRWISELLQSLGHKVGVVDPRRMKLVSGTLYKDDTLDAQTLAMLARDAPRLLKTVPRLAHHGRSGKDSDLRQWGIKKLDGGSRTEKKKMKVAMARKLAVLMITLWKSGQPYDRFRRTRDETKAA